AFTGRGLSVAATNLTTGSGLSVTNAGTGLTGAGNILLVSTGSTGAVTNGLARFNFTGAYTGNGLQVDSATATGTGVAVNTSALSSGTGLSVTTNGGGAFTSGDVLSVTGSNTTAANVTGSALLVTSNSAGAVTNGLARFNFTGAHTNNGLQIDDATATGSAVVINTSALSSGTGLSVTTNGGGAFTSGNVLSVTGSNTTAANVTGSALLVTSNSTGATTNGLARFNFTGAHTNNGLQVDDATATGKGVQINTNSVTTGTGVEINANALTSGVGLRVQTTINSANTGFAFSALAKGAGATANVTAAAVIGNFSTLNTASNVVLRLATGAVNTSTTARYIQFYSAASSETNGTGSGNIRQNNAGTVAYTTAGADFGEWFSLAESAEVGHLVSLGARGPHKAVAGESLLGAVSDTAGFIGNERDDQRPNEQVVGLAGRVRTFVSTENGPIAIGDRVTASSVPGVGMKATGAASVVGVALEAYDGKAPARISVTMQPSYYMPVGAAAQGEVGIGKFTSLLVSGKATIGSLDVRDAVSTSAVHIALPGNTSTGPGLLIDTGATAFTGTLLDIQIAGVSKFKVTEAGTIIGGGTPIRVIEAGTCALDLTSTSSGLCGVTQLKGITATNLETTDAISVNLGTVTTGGTPQACSVSEIAAGKSFQITCAAPIGAKVTFNVGIIRH
ncbi:MAG: hypothetical protein WCL53_06185, partial [Chloroflexota bacterium]